MKNYVLLVDVEKCTQCYNCVLACKDEHFGNDFSPVSVGCQELGQNWVDLKVVERGEKDNITVSCWPEGCRHCDDPECVKASDAAYKRDDGIVIIDPIKAEGQENLISACPYNAISWNSEKGLPQKCTMCAHLLDGGEREPRCVEACPTSTLFFGDASDPESEVSKLVAGHDELREQTGMVRYFNRPGRIIAGSVFLSEKEVAESIEVRLLDGEQVAAKTVTNGFGDFQFKNLLDGKDYNLEVLYSGTAIPAGVCDSGKDYYFREIVLDR